MSGASKLVPEGPQIRTMTFVCDLFSPHEGSISLLDLAEKCPLNEEGYGIVGLSCQLSTADGVRVVKRGQVKEARRHFAYGPARKDRRVRVRARARAPQRCTV
jgi:hypothetical protein